MKFLQRPAIDGFGVYRHRAHHAIGAHSRRTFAIVLIGIAVSCPAANAQIGDGTGKLSSASAFLTVGAENTQLPSYSDNALGFDLGVFTQPHPLVGLEFRAGAHPFSATYVQMPFTGGYRIAGRSLFGFPYAPFAYIGAGVSRSQDKGDGNVAYPPDWQRCWQVDVGFDRTYHSFSWRVAQASWRETYTPVHSLRSVGLGTGVVYRFQR